MKASKQTWLIICALVLLACLIVSRSRPDKPSMNMSGGPSFKVKVIKPRLARPLFGILPSRFEEKLEPGGERQFDHTSPGAKIGSVESNHLDLSADGWNLLIKTDSTGEIAPGTHLVYSMILAEKPRTLRCRPAADDATGYLNTTTRAASDVLDGYFLVELVTCENIETGKVIEWPPAPLTVRGSFTGLSQGQR